MSKKIEKVKTELRDLITKYNNSNSTKNKVLLYAQISALDKKLDEMKR